MFYGWAGVDLEIDLSRRNVEKTEADADVCRTYLGGRGMGSKILWDRVPPEAHPFSPENLLVLSAGVLAGTVCPGANRAAVTTRSPQNNLQTYASLGGFWANELKLAGYDNLIISGKSASPVYLWIDEDKVEIRDAGHLWGKDTFETQRLIKQELGNQDAQVACIGPAGENRVYCASIEHANGASVSRTGFGAVMGDKKLKAIAVRGRKDVRVARPKEFGELCDKLLVRSQKQRKWTDDYSHNELSHLIRLSPYGNMEMNLPFRETGDIHAKWLEDNDAKRPACFNCQLGCRRSIRLPGTGYAHLKCASHLTFWTNFKIEDFSFNFRAYHLLERLGMDSLSACYLGAFAIDLYQKGILNDIDTGGLSLEYGNEELALKLIEQIARREGIGDVLANGVYEAAQQIGRGAEQYAYHVKKMEQQQFAFQVAYIGLTAAVADRWDATRLRAHGHGRLLAESDEYKRAYLNSEFWPYPKEWGKYLKDTIDRTGGDWDRLSQMFSWARDETNLSDSTGICTFWTVFYPYSPIKAWDQAKLVSYATGIDVDYQEAFKMAARSGALHRAYNAILGIRRKDDTVPDIFFRESAGGVYPPLDRAKFNKVIEEYYKVRGWNEDGVPTRESLNELGLGYVAEELERRGIY